jgi:mannose-6-phosphate isomerase-like protein (cupin superfamily)
MPADRSRKLTPETVGHGVHDPRLYRQFSPEGGTVVVMYEDTDLSLVVWNLEPGQENGSHVHPESAHVLLVLEGQGERIGEGGHAVPIGAGQCIIVPRGVTHGIRNTGAERLSYLATTTLDEAGYVRQATD